MGKKFIEECSSAFKGILMPRRLSTVSILSRNAMSDSLSRKMQPTADKVKERQFAYSFN